eukprot:753389-Hanusia_phi.AAC.2
MSDARIRRLGGRDGGEGDGDVGRLPGPALLPAPALAGAAGKLNPDHVAGEEGDKAVDPFAPRRSQMVAMLEDDVSKVDQRPLRLVRPAGAVREPEGRGGDEQSWQVDVHSRRGEEPRRGDARGERTGVSQGRPSEEEESRGGGGGEKRSGEVRLLAEHDDKIIERFENLQVACHTGKNFYPLL